VKYRILFLVLAACGGRAATDDGPAQVGPSPRPTGGPTDPPAPVTCSSSAAENITVSRSNLTGTPPYSVSGCTLVYVNADGALVMRDLATGEEKAIASADEKPARPVVTPDLVAWEATAMSVVRVRTTADGNTQTLAAQPAGEPRAAGKSVVFTAWKTADPRGDTDVLLFDAAAGTTTAIFDGPAQQRWADVSDAWIVGTDFFPEEGPTGGFDNNGQDLADLVVFDRKTGTKTPRPAVGKQAFPMLTSTDAFAYLDWAAIHPEPKLEAFQLRAGKVTDAYAADHTVADVTYITPDYARPAVFGSTIEWVANPTGETVLWRAPIDGSAPPAQVQGLGGLYLYAPAPTTGFTVLAAAQVQSTDFTPRLRGVPRATSP
jgi:hypothetical protein